MDAVGEVEGGGAGREVEHIAPGGEHEHLVVEHVGLDALDKLLGAGELTLPLKELAQPGDALFVLGGAVAGALVAPVRRDAVLGHAVHLVGANLHLQGAGTGADDRGVEGLVHARLGAGDVVVELAGEGAPGGVHDAEGGVAGGHVLDEDAEGEEVVYLVERLGLAAVATGLLVDGIDVLGAARDLVVDAGVIELGAEAGGHVLDVALAGEAGGAEAGGKDSGRRGLRAPT